MPGHFVYRQISGLQRLLPLIAVGRATALLVIALIQSAKTVTFPMSVFRSAAALTVLQFRVETVLAKKVIGAAISTALLHLMVCSNSLQQQPIELVCALEAWVNAKALGVIQGVSHNPLNSRKPAWRIATQGMTQPVLKATYSYVH